ncbi:MAG: hypothetical protein H0M93_02850 [Methanophagales archaeon]|nr:hypothetical protein [Methanophagales archaeon]
MIAVLIILIIGLFADNRIVRRSYHWKVVSKVLDKIGVDEAVDKTAIGDTIKRSGMTTVRVFDALIRWFVYLIFIMAAVNVLNILVLTALMHQVVMHQVVLYIPHLILGIIVLVVGLIVADFVMDRIGEQLAAKKVEFADVITTVLRAIFYLVVIVFALDQLRVDTAIIYTFLVPLAWGIAAGIAIAMGIALGWRLKDVTADYVKEKLQEKKEGE